MTYQTVRIPAGCRRCRGDLEYDFYDLVYICTKSCGYRREKLPSDPTDVITAASTDVGLATLAKRLNITLSALKQRCVSRNIEYFWHHGKAWIPRSAIETVDYAGILKGRLVDVVDVDAEEAPAPAPTRELVTFIPPPEKSEPAAPEPSGDLVTYSPPPETAKRAAPWPSKKTAVAPTPGESRTVDLASGGSITLATDVRILDLSPDDRAFLFDLVDLLAAYGRPL